MNGEQQKAEAQTAEEQCRSEARRKFLKSSGGAAIAAPAVVLLLSTASVEAEAADLYSSTSTGTGTTYHKEWPPKKTVLDP